MPHVSTVVVGAGHSGLAISYYLCRLGIDHVLLERGRVANTWATERWDSLRLLTPNWLNRLPGKPYAGDDADGFMAADEVAALVRDYAQEHEFPVEEFCTVERIRRQGGRFEVETSTGRWTSDTVVLANGACNRAAVPKPASGLPSTVFQIHSLDYRSPEQIPDGGVLVVGSSATGLQIADELQQCGHHVTLAIGEHVRLPRIYREKDIYFWMERVGLLDERHDEIDDIVRARSVPSPQLIGSDDRRTLDLNTLTDAGAQLVGRFASCTGKNAWFAGSLRNVCKLADLKMNRLLNSIDDWIEEKQPDIDCADAERFSETRVDLQPQLKLDLVRSGINTVFWATGYKPDYSWLDIDTFDRKGYVKHSGGVGEVPGLYVLGLTFLRRRKSSFIHGAEDDAYDLSMHLAEYVGASCETLAS